MKYLRGAFVIVLVLALAGSAWALQGKGQAPAKGKKSEAAAEPAKAEKGKAAKPGPPRGFDKGEVDSVRVWFRTNQTGLPPGLTGRPLPPGLRRQLIRNGTLPPGLRRHLHPLPPALEIRLGKLPIGYKRCIIGADLVLVHERTFVIVDIVPDVIVIR